MAFTKITNSELNSRGATTLPNQPTISASALKVEFDAPAKNVVAPKVNNLIDELEATTSAASLGAQAPTGRTGATVQAVMNSISGDLSTVEVTAHSHSNKAVLDKFSEVSGDPYYDGNPIGGGGGDMDSSDYAALGITNTVDKAVNLYDGTNTLSASIPELNVLDGITASTTELNYLQGVTGAIQSQINGKSTVSYSQTYSGVGQEVGKITIDGTTTSIIAPNSGGGSGAVDSVNGKTGTVVLDLGDVNDVDITSVADNDTIVYDTNKWVNIPLSTVALSGSYSDLLNKPSIPTITDTYSGTSSDGMSGKAVKSAIDALDGTVSGSAGAGNTLTAFSQTDGKVSATFGAISITKSQVSDFPTIPTVNDSTITIRKNTTTVDTFTTNAASGKNIDIPMDYFTAASTVATGSVTFSGIDDSAGTNGYEPFANITSSSTNKNPTFTLTTISGEGTSSMSVTFSTDADNGSSVRLRILK